MRVSASLCSSGVRHYTVRTYVVASAHDRNESGYAVSVHPDRAYVGVCLFMRQQDVYLGSVRCYCLQKFWKASVCVRACHDVDSLKKLVLEPLRHTSYDADHDAVPLALLQLELVDPAPYPLLGIVAYRTCVCKDHRCLLDVVGERISCILEDGKDDFAVVHVHLTSVCLYVDLRSRRVCYRSNAVHDAKIGFFDEYRYLCEDVKLIFVRNRLYKLLIIILSAFVLTFTGCKNVRNVEITSVKVEAIAPQGLTGMNVFLAVGVDNPAFQVGFEDVKGVLKHSGKVLGRLSMDPFTVQGKSAEIYHLKALLTLGEDATLKDLLKLMDTAVLNECMIDVSLKARLKNSVAAPIEIKDIPLKKLLNSTGNEKN